MTVPSAMPVKPIPSGKANNKLATMLTMFTTRSTHMLLRVSCMPMNQPRKTISERVAGEAQMRMKKYRSARAETSGVPPIISSPSFTKGHCNIMRINEMARASTSPLPSRTPAS